MKWTQELLQELIEQEDAVNAYNNGYYDTHNLDYIGEHLSEYEHNLEFYKKKLPNPSNYFWEYRVIDGELFLKKD